MRIELLSRPACHLCDEAKRVLHRVCEERSLPWREINIETRPDLDTMYGEQIPVLLIDGKKAFKYFIDEKKLNTLLDRRAAS